VALVIFLESDGRRDRRLSLAVLRGDALYYPGVLLSFVIAGLLLVSGLWYFRRTEPPSLTSFDGLSMPNIVLRAEGVGKKYILRHRAVAAGHSTLRDTITGHATAVGRWLRSGGTPAGRPRHGKSSGHCETFLSRWNRECPGHHRAQCSGNRLSSSLLAGLPSPRRLHHSARRVASLLEVGTGFHPELTGRENIFLNGAILGMTRVEIRRKFDQIVAFAEVEQFLDTPSSTTHRECTCDSPSRRGSPGPRNPDSR